MKKVPADVQNMMIVSRIKRANHFRAAAQSAEPGFIEENGSSCHGYSPSSAHTFTARRW